jgi:hypothetical protein
MRIDNPGAIDILISSSHDIDFCCWGPFNDPVDPCPNGLTESMVVSCSYSSQSSEHCMIPATAQTGEYYILVITNYSNQTCNINFSKVDGDGTTDCTIMSQLSNIDDDYYNCASQNQAVFNSRIQNVSFTNHTISVVMDQVEGGTVIGNGNYQYGERCTVKANANNGYSFVNWTENGKVVSTNSSYSFVVTSDRSLVANYRKK